MAKVLVTESSLQDIADAIRAKGGTGTFTPAEMAPAIEALPSGGEDIGDFIDGSIISVSEDNVATVRLSAFQGCTSLTDVSLPAATSIGGSAFQDCTSLTDVSLPAATSIGVRAFFRCFSLTDISLPVATSIGSSAFQDCTSLTDISLPAATSIDSSAFQGCTSLTDVSLPVATSIGGSAFYSCNKLTELHVGTNKDTVCTAVRDLYLNGICTIYVPDALVEDYKVATNWSLYADQIKGESEAPTD